jgi:hypothetical protein
VVTAWQNGKVFGLSHYKHGPRRVNLGLPADYLESDEDALAAARPELHEGARLASEIWQHMGSYCIDGNPARRALISSQPMIVGPLKRVLPMSSKSKWESG